MSLLSSNDSSNYLSIMSNVKLSATISLSPGTVINMILFSQSRAAVWSGELILQNWEDPEKISTLLCEVCILVWKPWAEVLQQVIIHFCAWILCYSNPKPFWVGYWVLFQHKYLVQHDKNRGRREKKNQTERNMQEECVFCITAQKDCEPYSSYLSCKQLSEDFTYDV